MDDVRRLLSGEDVFRKLPVSSGTIFTETAIRIVVESLPERDRFIALHSFGLFGCREMQNKEIAEKLGCTSNTVINRKNAIMGSIRQSMFRWAA